MIVQGKAAEANPTHIVKSRHVAFGLVMDKQGYEPTTEVYDAVRISCMWVSVGVGALEFVRSG